MRNERGQHTRMANLLNWPASRQACPPYPTTMACARISAHANASPPSTTQLCWYCGPSSYPTSCATAERLAHWQWSRCPHLHPGACPAPHRQHASSCCGEIQHSSPPSEQLDSGSAVDLQRPSLLQTLQRTCSTTSNRCNMSAPSRQHSVSESRYSPAGIAQARGSAGRPCCKPAGCSTCSLMWCKIELKPLVGQALQHVGRG